MKTLIIYKSIHRRNTEKIAKAMAEAIDAKIVDPQEVQSEEVAKYNLVGFG
jgi:hypothetical protein